MAGKRILLVEGLDDEHVLKNICGARGIPHLDEVKHLGGVEALLDSIRVRLKASEYGDIIGVVIDADTDLRARRDSLRDRFVGLGYLNVPAEPSPEGAILDPPPETLLPRTGVWLMPDNKTGGILEDFLRFLVPQGSALFRHVESSVSTIPEADRRFSPLARPKAIIHTWLAWQEEPGRPLGTAITARYLDAGVVQVDALVSWLNRLFFA